MWEGGAWDNSEVRSEMSVGEGQQGSQGHTYLLRSRRSCHTGNHQGPDELGVRNLTKSSLWAALGLFPSLPEPPGARLAAALGPSPSIRELSLSLTAGGMFTRNCALSLSTSKVSSPSDFSMSLRVSLRDRLALDTPLI